MQITSTLVLFGIIGVSVAYPNGAPPDACQDLWPHHGSWLKAQPDESFPYDFEIQSVSTGQYGDVWQISLNGVSDDDYFRGLIAQVRVKNSTLGRFQLPSGTIGLRLINCAREADTLTQSSALDKKSLNVLWSRNSDAEVENYPDDELELVATIVKEFEIFWVRQRIRFTTADHEEL